MLLVTALVLPKPPLMLPKPPLVLLTTGALERVLLAVRAPSLAAALPGYRPAQSHACRGHRGPAAQGTVTAKHYEA